jgi:3-hydroxyisobutyrate dehydrogenase-like beta-hydroxyacid dehydrogenase
VFACVGNDDDLRSVVLGDDGAFAGMEAGAVFVDHTTASAEVARELHAGARRMGCTSSTRRSPAARPARSTAR